MEQQLLSPRSTKRWHESCLQLCSLANHRGPGTSSGPLGAEEPWSCRGQGAQSSKQQQFLHHQALSTHHRPAPNATASTPTGTMQQFPQTLSQHKNCFHLKQFCYWDRKQPCAHSGTRVFVPEEQRQALLPLPRPAARRRAVLRAAASRGAQPLRMSDTAISYPINSFQGKKT